MSLKKKIILSFLISSAIIAVLAASAYMNFIEIRSEIRYLELSDTLRSKTLQLRRHEKNFFLYGDLKEIESVHTYLNEIRGILGREMPRYRTETLMSLQGKVDEYGQRFNRIETSFWDFHGEFSELKRSYPKYAVFFPLVESTFMERPLVNAELLRKIFGLAPGNSLIANLSGLHTELQNLRKNGEEILVLSKDLDKAAREKVEHSIGFFQSAALVLFPLFLLVGLGTLFVITHSAVRRLHILAGAIEKAGEGDFSSLPLPEKHDEVGILIEAFNKMETALIERDREILRKNEELLQSRKLASIGTLASGVAHELNNPLNNIYLSAQILSREAGDDCPAIVRETVGDIFSQTLRVKRIVSDLLEFSREKPPELSRLNLVEIIHAVIQQMTATGELAGITTSIDAPEKIEVTADRHLMEQVFVNLFGNAADAMEGKGTLKLGIVPVNSFVRLTISDTGKGIPPENIQRVFDPFFTTKEKGTGLGLAIVYNIIERHKGKIEIASGPGKGTTLTITLPGA